MNNSAGESSRNFLIVFVAIVLLIFGGGSLVSYLANSPSPSFSSLTTCGCTIPMPTPVSCSNNYPKGADIGLTLFLPKNIPSSDYLCVKFFYYNSTFTATIDTLKQITIYSPTSSGTLNNVNSRFYVTANVSQIPIGGPQSENEGAEVAYRISSNASTPSGKYEIGFSSGLYPKDIICGWGIYIDLQVGNATNPIVMTSCHFIPAPENNTGLIYTEFVGSTNSS